MKYYIDAIRFNYANFSGRARRKEYWSFYIYNISLFGLAILADAAFNPKEIFVFIPATLHLLYPFLVVLPTLAITTRRLHDLGKNGIILALVLIPLIFIAWYFDLLELVWFIPILGPLAIFPLLIKNGENGQNQYGVCPKENDG